MAKVCGDDNLQIFRWLKFELLNLKSDEYMKSAKNAGQASPLTTDSQKRLFAYTTAAGLGAFFAGQSIEAQVTASAALGPYPNTLIPGGGTGYNNNYFYLDIDGNGTNDFSLKVNSYDVRMFEQFTGDVVLNPFVAPSTTYYGVPTVGAPYVIPWTNGMVINATNGFPAMYSPYGGRGKMAGYKYSTYYLYYPLAQEDGNVLQRFASSHALGFSFPDSNGQTHFGYMNIQVNGSPNATPPGLTVTVNGIYYNATADADIIVGDLPPPVVTITNISVGSGNAVTINFTSSDNAPASAFTLESTPDLGASANWLTDAGAIISSSAPGVYQAVTTGTGGTAQFFRIKH